MDKIQILFFFINGFLISRLLIKVHIPQKFVYYLIGKKEISSAKIVLYLIFITALLSFFIPNAITVLTLLPLIQLLRLSYDDSSGANNNSTMLALSVIYGANIGGMGSITATPANGFLITYITLNNIPGAEHITFASWLIWGIPLVACLVFISWLLLMIFFRPWKNRKTKAEIPFDVSGISHHHQVIALFVTALFFISSLIFSILIMHYKAHITLLLIITGLFSLLFALFLFIIPFKGFSADKAPVKTPLLSLRDCHNDLPKRGFFYVGAAVVLTGILYLLKIHIVFANFIGSTIPEDIPLLALCFLIALFSSFSTEILSNTAVQVGMFMIIPQLSELLNISAVPVLLIITLSCTCAFMSPIATGVNGLAFGEIKDISLRKMLLTGFVMNIAGAMMITLWVYYIVGWIYGF